MQALHVTSEINPTGAERRFDVGLKISELKQKLVLITGVEVAGMQLELFLDGQSVRKLTDKDEEISLGELLRAEKATERDVRFHVTDASGQSAGLLDEQQVPKYVMDEAKYDQRKESLRAFKKQQKLGRFAEKKEQDDAVRTAAGEE